MADILILVGTESGNAELVAETLAEELGPAGHEVEVMAEAHALPKADRVVLICTSTHGDGDLPDNIIPLQEMLSQSRPDLAHLRYGVIALGDQTFADTFCGAGRQLDALFAGLGATKVGERLEIDACTQPLPDDEALTWAQEWVTLL